MAISLRLNALVRRDPLARRTRRRRGLPRLRREAYNYRPQPLGPPPSREGWLLCPPVLNLAGGGVLRRYPE